MTEEKKAPDVFSKDYLKEVLPLPPPPAPAPFGSGKVLDLKTGKVKHPSLGEVDASEFITEPLPADAVRGTPTPTNELPPFELPGGEDDPAGSVPAHHVAQQDLPPGYEGEDLREKIGAKVREQMEEWQKRRVPDAKKYLEDARTIAPEIAKTVKSIYNSLITEGFTPEAATAFTQTILDKKLQPFL